MVEDWAISASIGFEAHDFPLLNEGRPSETISRDGWKKKNIRSIITFSKDKPQ